MWLNYIRKIGMFGGTPLREPVTDFNGEWFTNRVDNNGTLGVARMRMRRIINVQTAMGSQIDITLDHENGCPYGGTNDTAVQAWLSTKTGNWDTNKEECFNVYFSPEAGRRASASSTSTC